MEGKRKGWGEGRKEGDREGKGGGKRKGWMERSEVGDVGGEDGGEK